MTKDNPLSQAQLTAAYWSGKPVTVYHQGELVNYGGKIEKMTPKSVTINGATYLRSTCTFVLKRIKPALAEAVGLRSRARL